MGKIREMIFSPILIRIFTVGLNFISNILINRSLGIELRGQYTSLLNLANFLQLLLNLGICYAYPVLMKKDKKSIAQSAILTIIWIQTIVCLIISAIIVIISPHIKILAITILATIMICNNQLFFMALIDDIKKRNLFLLSSTILFIFFNFISILLFPGKMYIIIGLLIIKYVYEIVIVIKKNKYVRFDVSLLNKERLLLIFKTGLPTAVLAILISCSYNINIFMLDWMKSGDVQVGIYGVAYSLSNMVWILPDTFKELIYNKTARENDYEYIIKSIFLNMVICIAVCLWFLIFGKWFLVVMYGLEYQAAFGVCFILFCGVIPMVSFKLIHPIYVNNGKSGVVTGLLSVAVTINILLSMLLIPQYKALGAAIASVVSYLVCGMIFFFKFYIDYKVRK